MLAPAFSVEIVYRNHVAYTLGVTINNRTEGEQRFEAYLNTMGYPFVFEKEHPGKHKRPDYTLAHGGNMYLFDVKDADPYAPRGFNQFDPFRKSLSA